VISAEALVAQIGVIPGKDEMLTKEDGKAAVGIEALWRAEVRAWFDQTKPKRFQLCKQYPFEKTLDLLSSDLPGDLFSQLTQAALVTECQALLDRARAYALSKWPVRYLDRPERQGGVLLQPGQIELMEACATLAVLDDPDRVVDELRMETLEDTQVTAFKSVFPDLHKMLVAICWDEIDRKAHGDKEWFMTWPTELIFRRLIGLPPEMSISKEARPEPAAAHPTIKVDFGKLKTNAQRLNEK
jgi:hypothetical protein